MRYRVIILACLLLCLLGCGAEEEIPATLPPTTQPPTTVETAAPTETTAPAETTEPPTEPPVYISPLAVEDLLLPVEEYSWERQFDPEFVMIHFTSAVTTHRDDPYNMAVIRDIFVEYDISVHYIIGRDGTVYCYVPEDRVAWHAGAGEWNGDEKYKNTMNQYAIGIELAAIGSETDMSIYLTPGEYRALDDALKGFTQEQYAALKLLVEDICQRNAIPMDREHVIGHSDYSTRKPDPGELFDWSKLIP